MTVSESAYSLIRQFEGCLFEAYKCPAGIWTIGWGHTEGVVQGQTCSQALADWWLQSDVIGVARALTKALGSVQLRQCEFDALVSLAFNCGPNVAAYAPHLWAGIMRGDAPINIANNFLDIDHDANGAVQPGLTRRRKAEAWLYRFDRLPDLPAA
jgi:lysozyme